MVATPYKATAYAFAAVVLGVIMGAVPLPEGLYRPIMKRGIAKFEANKIPDFLSRAGVQLMIGKTLQKHETFDGPPGSERHREYVRGFISDLKQRSIAEQTKEANVQHYEVDTSFYNLVLGKNRKYSSAMYPSVDTPPGRALELLDEAEERMLRLYAERARITTSDRFRIMDLGCGWGSATLWFAKNFPNSEIVGLSNSRTQREYILAEANKRGLTNVDVLTGDIDVFELPQNLTRTFDRVITIEMMEHMKNYELLLQKISKNFLKPDGLLFIHIFVARTYPSHYVVDGSPSDWMTQHFFTGGTMPSDNLLLHFQKDVYLLDRWRVNGRHYSLTLEAWLQQMDQRKPEVDRVLAQIYGEDNVTLWTARWRAFFFSCSELFKYDEGRQYYVAHYLFQAR